MSGSLRSSSGGRGERRRKRPYPPVLTGTSNSAEDKDSDFLCPICFDVIQEAYMTMCGHSFCHKCIKQCLEQSNRCPKCTCVIEKPDQIFPNFLLNELLLKYKQRQELRKRVRFEKQNGFPGVEGLDVLDPDHLDLPNVNYWLELLSQRKVQLEGENKMAQIQILMEFLEQMRQQKQQQLDKISQELKLISDDMKRTEEMLREIQKHNATLSPDVPVVNGLDACAGSLADHPGQDGFNGAKSVTRPNMHTSMASRRKRMHQHFEDLQLCYLNARQRDILPSSVASVSDGNAGRDSLIDFTESLSKFTKFSSLRTLATLNYANDIYNTSSIVSSIEFDRDCDYFAIAGVTKKIKIFEYSTVIKDAVDVHYPVNEMVCNSKISSVVWSSYHKGMLASSDYEGTVTLWDAFTGVKSRIFQEHEKRCWSVDFNNMDPNLLASGSDDSRVKLWYTNMEHSVASLEAKANVCCVKFRPDSRFHLAFGSADHCVHYYDLRNTKQPLMVFKGHRKAVSYTKFVNNTEIVSASTDSQLKLWTTSKSSCVRTFHGHTNEKNFVGLSSNGDYIACGSENNSLYIYYKGLSKQLLTFKFDTVRSVLEKDKKEDDTSEFISAVCWRPDSNVIFAANSQGIIKVLELV